MKKLALIFSVLFSFLTGIAQPDTRIDSLADSLKHAIQLAKHDTNKIQLLLQLTDIYLWSRPDSTIAYAQQGMQLARGIDDRSGENQFKQTVAMSFWIMGDYLQADKMLIEVLKFVEMTHDTVWIGGVNATLASNKRDKGDYREALQYTFETYRLCGECEFSKLLIGSVYVEMNLPDSALFYLKQGPAWAYTTWLLGRAYDEKGNRKLAYQYYHQSVSEQLAGDINFKDLSNGYKNLAQLFQKDSNEDSSIFYAEKAYRSARDGHYTKGMWEAALLLSNFYEANNPRESLRYYKLATAAKDSLFSLQKTTQFLNAQFDEQLQQKEEEAARINYRNQMRTYVLLAGLAVFILVIILLYRNIRHKQKSKIEIENAYENLKATQAQLIQSEKMASLGELTAGIAHEIQNPLNFVNNFSEVNGEMIGEAIEEIGNGNYDEVAFILHNIKDNSEKINQHGRRADAIVKNMLQHSRQAKSVRELTDINALCDEYLRLSYHGLRAKDKNFNADFTTDFDKSIGKINIVPQDMGRVLLNLFNNALYAVNEKKKTANEYYKPKVSVTTKKLNNTVEIVVTDNGNGIPQRIIDKIFQPFFTTKPTGQGTGLGLSLSYDIITKEHNGTIEAESKEGEGTTFTIEIPG